MGFLGDINSVGGSMPIIFTYFCEFLPPRNRGFYLSCLAASWMMGSLLTAGLAWVVLSHSVCRGFDDQNMSIYYEYSLIYYFSFIIFIVTTFYLNYF